MTWLENNLNSFELTPEITKKEHPNYVEDWNKMPVPEMNKIMADKRSWFKNLVETKNQPETDKIINECVGEALVECKNIYLEKVATDTPLSVKDKEEIKKITSQDTANNTMDKLFEKLFWPILKMFWFSDDDLKELFENWETASEEEKEKENLKHEEIKNTELDENGAYTLEKEQWNRAYSFHLNWEKFRVSSVLKDWNTMMEFLDFPENIKFKEWQIFIIDNTEFTFYEDDLYNWKEYINNKLNPGILEWLTKIYPLGWYDLWVNDKNKFNDPDYCKTVEALEQIKEEEYFFKFFEKFEELKLKRQDKIMADPDYMAKLFNSCINRYDEEVPLTIWMFAEKAKTTQDVEVAMETIKQAWKSKYFEV